jgi:hypothetical protein
VPVLETRGIALRILVAGTLLTGLLLALGGGCTGSAPESDPAVAPDRAPEATPATETTAGAPAKAQRRAFFGDLHLHTALSIDAYITNTRTLPEDAYRYAKGDAIPHVSGDWVRIRTPLDFLAVTDHAEILGVARAMADPDDPLSRTPLAADITSDDYEKSHRAFRKVVGSVTSGDLATNFPVEESTRAVRSAWREVIDAAERHYEPGRFTTFVAYEWSSMPGGSNLHRNVIFEGADVPDWPFASTDSDRPEDLWTYLEEARERGDDAIAIPHNANASRGLMYPLEDSDGQPIDEDYAERRMRNEPVTEVTQFKGTSETHTALSPLDEFADFELWNTLVGSPRPIEPHAGSYVRSAYGRGLALEAADRGNPYMFSLIGASDSHDSSSAVEEFNFTGGHGNADATPQIRLNSRASTLTASSLNFSASGLAGVWAEENTREAIFAALRRGETFATSGPRLRVRLFAGEGYPPDLHLRRDAIARAYAGGVPMGSSLAVWGDEAPRLLVWALRDPKSAPLERIQIVKVSLRHGEPVETIHDVACSDGLRPDLDTHRCPDNGATIDPTTCEYSRDVGAGQLRTTWRDPDYAPGERAVYYARVLENPTCRWSTWDAITLGVDPPFEVPATIRERAWSSPIWLRPGGA